MIEVFWYWMMQKIGYRRFYLDFASYLGINLTSYSAWVWRPWMEKGTYRERRNGYKFAGYGVDK